MRRVHVSDTDLDGEGCLVLYHAVYPGAELIRMRYGTIETELPLIAADLEEGDHLMITDLNLKESLFNQLISHSERGVKIRVLDHHPTTQQIIEEYPAYVNDENLKVLYSATDCGTLMLHRYLKDKFRSRVESGLGNHLDLWSYDRMLAYDDFVRLINDYDIWIHNDPQSRQLNDLFWLTGAAQFHDRWFHTSDTKFSPAERGLLEVELSRKARYLEEKLGQAIVLSTGNDLLYAVVYADLYVSEVGHHLLQRLNLDFAIMLDLAKNKGSIRSKETFNAREFASKFVVDGVQGGGQDMAAGFPLDANLTGVFKTLLTTYDTWRRELSAV